MEEVITDSVGARHERNKLAAASSLEQLSFGRQPELATVADIGYPPKEASSRHSEGNSGLIKQRRPCTISKHLLVKISLAATHLIKPSSAEMLTHGAGFGQGRSQVQVGP